MKTVTRVLLLLWIGRAFSTAEGQQSDSAPGARRTTAGTAASSAIIPPAVLHDDFGILRRALEEGSPGLYRHTRKAAFDEICAQVDASLDQPMTAMEFYRRIAPVIAAVKNGHTSLRIPLTESQALDDSVLLLPLGVRVLGDTIDIVRDFDDQRLSLASLQIQAINGVTAPQLIADMKRTISADGDTQTSRDRIMSGVGFIDRLATVFGWRDRFIVTLHDPHSGANRDVTLTGRPWRDIQPEWRQEYPHDLESAAHKAFGLRFFNADAIALLVIPHWDDFTDDNHTIPIQTFFRSAFQQMRQRGTRALIIDVRDNGGGEDSYGTLLASYLLNRPFEYFSDIWMNDLTFQWLRYAEDSYRAGTSDSLPSEITALVVHGSDGHYHLTKRPNWGVQQLSSPGFRGLVYVLINGNSFSTSAEFASVIWSHRRAQFVGEEASGYWRANTSGPDPTLTLPGSKLRLTVPLVEFDIAVRDEALGPHGIKPDRHVTYSLQDLIGSADNDTPAALGLARQALELDRSVSRSP
jgi:hypothetical protein